ncbi:MAG: hypothetical protein IPG93_05245 [Burkholderiales bacterium]|nr:hypothetical protein [Burkholderiales bacterium]
MFGLLAPTLQPLAPRRLRHARGSAAEGLNLPHQRAPDLDRVVQLAVVLAIGRRIAAVGVLGPDRIGQKLVLRADGGARAVAAAATVPGGRPK